MEAEFAGRVQFAQTGHELAAKHAAEHLDRQKEPGAGPQSTGYGRATIRRPEPRNGYADDAAVSDSRCAAR